MAIGPKGPPQKPGLSIRGRVIFDTVRGVPRARPWPPKKPTKPGSKRNLTAKAFGAANRACKVTASVFYGEHWAATRGTPLLPRDLMIAMMYGRAFALETDDGRIIRSMASRNDVSKSLDMIGNTKGAYLRRGDNYWELAEFAGTQRGAMIGMVADRTSQDYSPGKMVDWNHSVYDVGTWADLGAAPTKLTTIAGVSYVRLHMNISLADVALGQTVGVQLVKNGTAAFYGAAQQRTQISNTFTMASVSSPPIPTVEGDEWECYLDLSSDNSVTIRAPFSTFAIEAVA